MAEPRAWRLAGGAALALDRARILAILNVTPDSFSDGGLHLDPAHAAARAIEAAAQGTDMLDIGGESTRPGAVAVGGREQIERVVPAIHAIRAAGVRVPISVDTTRADVASAALDAGANAVNDQSAGRDEEAMLPLVASRGAGLILMHRLRPPGEDQYSDRLATPPVYEGGVVAFVLGFLRERIGAALAAGVAPDAIAIDPGLGFGKTVEQNLALIDATREFANLGFPVVCAASRKSFLGAATGQKDPALRVAESVSAALAMRRGGASIFRVHDVAQHVAALRESRL